MMFENPRVTMDRLSDELPVNRSTVAGYCLNMQEKGVPERVGSKKNGRRVVKTDL